MAAGAMLLTAGTAQGAEKIHLGLGGYFKAFAVFGRQDDGPGQPGQAVRDHGFAQESEVHFTGRTRLDNGIAFGVDVQLEGETSADQIDESYIYAEGTFGKVIFGQEDPASDLMFYGSPWAIQGIGVASPDHVNATLGNAVASPQVVSNISGDAAKITYFTPTMGGFQLGLSYTPDNCAPPAAACASAGTGLQSRNNIGQQSEVVEAGATYDRKIGGVDVGLYAGLARANAEGTAAALAAAGTKDREQWGLGVTLGYGAFTFGADYREDDQGTSAAKTDRTDYSLGVNYVTGSWTLGAAYAHGQAEAGVGLGQDETDGYQIGVNYVMGPGIKLISGVTYWDVDDNLNAVGVENTATEFIFGTLLSF